jgi:pimeloyl-ACP methyl ester carboxylesterase
MKTIRQSASYERSLFSLVMAAALLFGAGDRSSWAQVNGRPPAAPDLLSVKPESPRPVEPAPVPDATLSSSRPQEAAPSPSATPGVATSTNSAAPAACAAPNTSPALPVIFIPGTAGSELRLTSAQLKLKDMLYWIGGTTLGKNNLGRAPLDERGEDREGNSVTAPRALSVFSIPNRLALRLKKRNVALREERIYSDFLLWSEAVFKGGFYEVPYDWRKGASPEAAALIARVVEQALCRSGQQQVILLSHSLGGIVARDYIQQSGGKNVAALIAVGTPWLGTPKTARALLWGYNFGAGKVLPTKNEVVVQGDAEDFAGTTTCKTKNGKPGFWCPYPARLSFLKLEETARLARNFPAVYQQLPTKEFMEKYGAFYTKDSHLNFRPVILGMKSWDEMEKFYANRDERKRGNEFLYTKTQALRERILNTTRPDDYGVHNYLIAGVYDRICMTPEKKDAEKCDLDNVMDMQMAGREKIKRNFRIKLQSLGVRALGLIVRPLGFILTREKFVLEEDRYVATDSDVDWGDGTAPLLSATAGEYLKGAGDHRFPGAASALLGEKTQVETLTLGPSYPHSSMLDDPGVREKLLRIYGERNLAAGLDPNPGEMGEIVTSLKIEFFLKTPIVGSSNTSIKVSFTDGAQEPDAALVTGNKVTISFKNPQVRDTRIVIPNVRHDESPLGVPRSLQITECPRIMLELRKNGGRELEFSGYRVTVNDKPVYSDDQSFILKSNPHTINFRCQ